MSHFCNACSRELFGGKYEFALADMAGITSHEAWENGKATIVLCEGCGTIQVDPYGNCVSPDCLRSGKPGHGMPWKAGPLAPSDKKEEYKKNPAFCCKHCGELLEWRPEWRGKRAKCYKCNGYFTFPNKPD